MVAPSSNIHINFGPETHVNKFHVKSKGKKKNKRTVFWYFALVHLSVILLTISGCDPHCACDEGWFLFFYLHDCIYRLMEVHSTHIELFLHYSSLWAGDLLKSFWGRMEWNGSSQFIMSWSTQFLHHTTRWPWSIGSKCMLCFKLNPAGSVCLYCLDVAAPG